MVFCVFSCDVVRCTVFVYRLLWWKRCIFLFVGESGAVLCCYREGSRFDVNEWLRKVCPNAALMEVPFPQLHENAGAEEGGVPHIPHERTALLVWRYFNYPLAPSGDSLEGLEKRRREINNILRSIPLHMPPDAFNYGEVWREVIKIEAGTQKEYRYFCRKFQVGVAERALRDNCFFGLVPVHRIAGVKPSLLGFAQILDDKLALLRHERGIMVAI
ncbi:hypothetical protein, conserved [Trypanosoma brucei brucei TREU927]|uniref:Uncharacterized protein n=1 Tax=Trypanosoma brucei brucei (strain 927/4 GUTat10.1) TaxID=185431 RepID=Q38FP0_TRYB2|nr:hypothetical protein, conserved [Trypanosoma brucei brucei TREU927]EAN76380.1 hypothetical protein, conserved [Trypanosoma brucei brucei TREU927]